MAGSQRAVLEARCVGTLLDLQSYISWDERDVVSGLFNEAGKLNIGN